MRKLWQALNHPDTLANLGFVGKSYGGGALKVEPRQLDALEIPQHVIDRSGLVAPVVWQEQYLLETFRKAPESKKKLGHEKELGI